MEWTFATVCYKIFFSFFSSCENEIWDDNGNGNGIESMVGFRGRDGQ